MTNNILKQKTVLITGANNLEDIGAAITKLFHNSKSTLDYSIVAAR